MNLNLHALTKTCESFVDRVVDDFINAMVQARLIGITNVHTWSLADGFKTLEALDVRGFVGCFTGVFASAAGGFRFAHR